jgi:hypothetical protein
LAVPSCRLQPALSEESLRAAVGDALGGAVREILEQQAALLEELAGQPQVGRAGQWHRFRLSVEVVFRGSVC